MGVDMFFVKFNGLFEVFFGLVEIKSLQVGKPEFEIGLDVLIFFGYSFFIFFFCLFIIFFREKFVAFFYEFGGPGF